jgi:peptidoglycan/LPS O-acetylase OafA/YrhL
VNGGSAEKLTVAPSTGTRLPGIEGLRAIAASSIVLVHVWSTSMPNGEVLGSVNFANGFSTLSAGLTLFFTLSGFLLYRPFAAAIARGTPRQSIAAYLQNRALRILPAYWVILLAVVLIGAASVRVTPDELGVGRLTDPLELGQTALLLQDYRPGTMVIGIGPAWSLAVEVVFYLVLPVLVLAAGALARRAATRRDRILILLAPAVLLLFVGLTGKLAAGHLVAADPLAGYNSDWHSVIERSFWAQADLFAFGMLVAVLHTEVTDGRLRLRPGWRWIAVIAALLVFLPCAWTMKRGEHSYLLQNTGQALAIAIALAAIVLPDRSERRLPRAVRVLESVPFVAVGAASYSLFLWHYPVIEWLREQGLTIDGGWAALGFNFVLVAIVAGGLSALTYRYVERPALRHKRRGRKETATPRPLTTAPASATALGHASHARD